MIRFGNTAGDLHDYKFMLQFLDCVENPLDECLFIYLFSFFKWLIALDKQECDIM